MLMMLGSASTHAGDLARPAAEIARPVSVGALRARESAPSNPDRTCSARWASTAVAGAARLTALMSPARAVSQSDSGSASSRVLDPCRPLSIAEPVQRRLEDAGRLQQLGRLDEALAAARETIRMVEQTGVPCHSSDPERQTSNSPELAAAELRLAEIRRARGEPRLALAALFRAQLHAIVCHDDVRYAEARLHSAETLVSDLGRIDPARVALAEAKAQLDRLEAPLQSAMRHDQWRIDGLLAEAEGDHVRARSSYETSLVALDDPEHHPQKAARVLSDLGRILRLAGNEAEAATMDRRAFELLTSALGVEHPVVEDHAARIALDIGRLRALDGRHEGAIAFFREAVRRGLPETSLAAYAAWLRSADELGRDGEIAGLGTTLQALFLANGELPAHAVASVESTLGRVLVDRDPEGTIEWLGRAAEHWNALLDHEAEHRDRLLLARVLHEEDRDQDALAQFQLVRRHLDALHPNEVVITRRLGSEIAGALPNIHLTAS